MYLHIYISIYIYVSTSTLRRILGHFPQSQLFVTEEWQNDDILILLCPTNMVVAAVISVEVDHDLPASILRVRLPG